MTDLLAKKTKEQANIESLLKFVATDLKEKQADLEAAKRRHKETVYISVIAHGTHRQIEQHNREIEKMSMDILEKTVSY